MATADTTRSPAPLPALIFSSRWLQLPLYLGLIDVVMISNLLVMVIVGGYETFVSRLNLQGHPDQPEWLSHVNASVLKVKLVFILSALGIAWTDRLMGQGLKAAHK